MPFLRIPDLQINCTFMHHATQVEDTEPLNDGKSTPGECLGELSFFFGMRHIYTAKACTSTSCFVLERSVFQQVLKMYPDEEDAIASNALQTYEKAWSRAGSQSQASGKSGASSVRSVQETMDGIIGGNLKQTIAVLRNRRKIEAVERTMKMAARNNIPELLKRFRSGISVNATNHDGRTCLHIAACYGHVELAKILLDSLAADTSIVDRHGNTPINDAGEPDYLSPKPLFYIPPHLTVYGLNNGMMCFTNSHWWPRLNYFCCGFLLAVRHMQDEVAAVLREHGCAIRMETCEVACILCQAAFDNDLDTLRRYVMNGADPGAGDYDARTALHLAASEGHIELVNYLLKQVSQHDFEVLLLWRTIYPLGSYLNKLATCVAATGCQLQGQDGQHSFRRCNPPWTPGGAEGPPCQWCSTSWPCRDTV